MAALLVHHLSLLTGAERADWITLDMSGMLLLLVAWALAAGFALAGVVQVAIASFPQPRPKRAKHARKAVVCFALAPFLGFGLTVIFDGISPKTSDSLTTWSILWAPALATVCGLFVRQVGRLE